MAAFATRSLRRITSESFERRSLYSLPLGDQQPDNRPYNHFLALNQTEGCALSGLDPYGARRGRGAAPGEKGCGLLGIARAVLEKKP